MPGFLVPVQCDCTIIVDVNYAFLQDNHCAIAVSGLNFAGDMDLLSKHVNGSMDEAKHVCVSRVSEIVSNGMFMRGLVHVFPQILLLNDGMRGLKASHGEQQQPSCNPGFVQLVAEAAHCFVSIGCRLGEHCSDQSVRFLILC